MEQSVGTLLVRYLEEPNPELFRELQSAVAASPEYDPYGPNNRNKAGAFLDQERYDQAYQYLDSIMKDWMLNPGIHHMMAFVHFKRGEHEDAESERYLGQMMLRGILSTGDGSEKWPYHVLRIKDEYDVVESQEKQFARQELIERDIRSFDRITCGDGSQIWFDITIPKGRLAISVEQQFGQSGAGGAGIFTSLKNWFSGRSKP